jgi:proteic killer suppression protein
VILDTCKKIPYEDECQNAPEIYVIKKFRHKGLAELFEFGVTARIDKKVHARILARLDALDAAAAAEDMNVPGWIFHSLIGFNPKRFTVHVNGPWCITFEFEAGDAYRVDFEQYH